MSLHSWHILSLSEYAIIALTFYSSMFFREETITSFIVYSILPTRGIKLAIISNLGNMVLSFKKFVEAQAVFFF
jgi:hypothetical protein